MTAAEPLAGAVRRQHQRSLLAIGLLCAVIATNLCALLALFSQSHLLAQAAAGSPPTEAVAAANDARITLIGQLHLAAFIASAVTFLVWFYSAYATLRFVGSGKTRLSAGSATGDWFIPFLNLVRPHRNTAEIWNRGTNGNSLDDVSG